MANEARADYTGRKLDKIYWWGAAVELVRLGLAEAVPGRHYLVTTPLPAHQELDKKVAETLYTKPMSEWYEDAKGDEESLRDEMVEWRDNMEGAKMKNTPRYDEVREAADCLENTGHSDDFIGLGRGGQ